MPMGYTTNAYGQIVSGSLVRLPDATQVYNVGEVYGNTAYLYIGAELIKKADVKDLVAL